MLELPNEQIAVQPYTMRHAHSIGRIEVCSLHLSIPHGLGFHLHIVVISGVGVFRPLVRTHP